MASLLDTALSLIASGISVIPVTGIDKRPAVAWKAYQSQIAEPATVEGWFPLGRVERYGLGVVTGDVSGNLELTEIEGRAVDRLADLATAMTDGGHGELWAKLGRGWVEQSPSGGVHWLYRVDGGVPGNEKIARNAEKEVLAETRGRGGYVVVAPTPGRFHASGNPWSSLSAGHSAVVTLTHDERSVFHHVLRELLDERPPSHSAPNAERPPASTSSVFSNSPARDYDSALSPGDDFENHTSWADILTPHGWTVVYRGAGAVTYWQRPGKSGDGISASTGYAEDRDRLYVFTTSTDFEPEVPYTKFGAHALLNHGGDHSAAAAQLRRDGFGAPATITALPTPEPIVPVPSPGDTPAPATEGTAALAPVIDLGWSRTEAMTDDGNALALINRYGEVLRFNVDRDRWFTWETNRWIEQGPRGGSARELGKALARSLPTDRDDQEKWRRRSLSARGISDMLTQAATDHRIIATNDAFDAHPWELNTPGGVLDLRTGTLTPAHPSGMHTRMTAIAPDFTADRSRWERFMETTFPASDVRAYVKRLLGYMIVGEVREHVLPFAFGSGGNGKSVLTNVLLSILGDYGQSSPAGFLMAKQFSEHSTEVARLSGARFVVCSEVNEADRFDEAKVKSLTGGDRLTARFMRQDNFDFRPTHHLWLSGNYQPAVESGGQSFWRRLRLIPFTHTVPDAERIDGLEDLLVREDGPAILAWLAEGAAAYHRHGLQEPPSVLAATAEYRASTDTVGRFLEDEAQVYEDESAYHHVCTVAQVRNAYTAWCAANGEDPIDGRPFTTQLKRHGILVGRDAPKGPGGVRMYGGIRLRAEDR